MTQLTPPPLAEPLLLEMLRTFVVLSNTLNVSHAVEILGSTRQTIKRHIRSLEENTGKQLFHVSDKNYRLSEDGAEAAQTAARLLIDANNWVLGQTEPLAPVQRYTHFRDNSDYTYLEEKGLNDVFFSDTPFMKECLINWLDTGGKLEQLKVLRRYGMIFRPVGNSWTIVEVGEEASATTWFGTIWRNSCLGQQVDNLPASHRLAPISNSAFETIRTFQSARLDHICTFFPRDNPDLPVPISYKRLTLATTFDDGSPALLSLVERTYDIRIANLPKALRMAMPVDLIMNPKL